MSSVTLPAGTVPIRSLTTDEILTGNRSSRFRFDLLSLTDAPKGTVDGVISGSVDYTQSASIHSGGEITIVDNGQNVDFLNDRIKPVLLIGGIETEYPLGVFIFSEAPETWSGTGRTFSCKLLDKTAILDQDAVEVAYALASGTVVTTSVISLISGAGQTNYSVTPSTATLLNPLVWEPGTTKLRIINDLLDTINYRSLYCNGNGQFIAEPYVRPAQRPVLWEFLDDENSIYVQDFVKDVDLLIPNKFVAVGQGDGTTAALTSSYTNTAASSPYSTTSRGRTIAASETGVEAVDQTTLDNYARRRLIELSSPTSSVEVKHAFVPNLDFNDAVRLRNVPAGIDNRHVVQKSKIAFDPTALVTSTLEEVVDL